MKKFCSKFSFPGILFLICLIIFIIALVIISNIKKVLIFGLILAIVFGTGTALYHSKK